MNDAPKQPVAPSPDAMPAEAAAPKPAPEKLEAQKPAEKAPEKVKETGGPKGPEPTRYGDWERKGRCVDF